jgi:hypothetical protein
MHVTRHGRVSRYDVCVSIYGRRVFPIAGHRK